MRAGDARTRGRLLRLGIRLGHGVVLGNEVPELRARRLAQGARRGSEVGHRGARDGRPGLDDERVGGDHGR